MTDALFDLTDLLPTAEDAGEDPKTLREALASGLIRSLEMEAARLEDSVTDHWPDTPAQHRAGKGPGEPWQSWYAAVQLRATVRWLRRTFALTHEEYLLASAEWAHRTVTDADLECARHRDHCPCCTSIPEIVHRLTGELARTEKARGIYVQGIYEIRGALDQAADKEKLGEPHQVTLKHVAKWLDKVGENARRAWTKDTA